MAHRARHQRADAPMSIYEVHLGSWRRRDGRWLSYREAAEPLADYVASMGFTHVEFLPLMEHPFYGSWGYQITGYFAATARYGRPQDLMYLIDYLHQRNIGVILDWVPSHFPNDPHGLATFDGSFLYEHADPRLGIHPDWNSCIFNYGRHEVRSFLLSSALFWLERYHADGLRVDAVASMLYRDYSRKPGEWIPNQFGGRENIEAIELLRRLNAEVAARVPGALSIAEESTSWPMVTAPAAVGGLGFGYKWDMGWMHDTLDYLARDPIHRKHHHQQLTFRRVYAYSERFILPLSHDEVVHGKGSLLRKMPGDRWQQMANVRLLFAWQCAQPGKPLLFMGDEFGQAGEWDHDAELDWASLRDPAHAGVQQLLKDMNRLHRDEPALHAFDAQPDGFEWVDANDVEQSVISFLRHGPRPDDTLLVVCNFTPVPRSNYRVGVPREGWWREVCNTDASIYGGSGRGNQGGARSGPIAWHGRPHLLTLELPPLAAIFLKRGDRLRG
jgi:1,4-alpha-glucan branching enzyme